MCNCACTGWSQVLPWGIGGKTDKVIYRVRFEPIATCCPHPPKKIHIASIFLLFKTDTPASSCKKNVFLHFSKRLPFFDDVGSISSLLGCKKVLSVYLWLIDGYCINLFTTTHHHHHHQHNKRRLKKLPLKTRCFAVLMVSWNEWLFLIKTTNCFFELRDIYYIVYTF